MSKRVKEWRKRLENYREQGSCYGGDDILVDARYVMYIHKERADDLCEALANQLFVSHLIKRMTDADESICSLGLYVNECVIGVIEHWLKEHKWWDAFTRWVISEIEYAELSAG